ncbi:hypothetical protein WJX81_004377 [Elliptochloris bilobata]|uniref:Cryptochrome/DNA photolyase FAD-binding domain-containing protein n=1 Tax=Elliptochloris bilobata TaxID=381761 RepID=A0AAW1RKD7_9CHLO
MRAGFALELISKLPKLGPYQCLFLLEALHELRAEEAVAAALEEAASAVGATCAVHAFWGATLYRPQDLPSAAQFRAAAGAKPLQAGRGGAAAGPVTGEDGRTGTNPEAVDLSRVAVMPGVMTDFIKGVSAHARVCPPMPAPERLQPPPPLPERFMLDIPVDARAAYSAAGAYEALEALEELTSISYTGGDGKRSAPGPAPDAADGADTLAMHLQFRDFFIFSALRAGDWLGRPGGQHGAKPRQPWAPPSCSALSRWCAGRTGLPFVDAAMRELGATGFMNNRGRQNAASFFAKGLHQDWRLGAAVFQALLIDHDTAVNAGNWAYNAGVGADPRNRTFRTVSQGTKYDSEARYIRAWVPELAGLEPDLAHEPWRLPADEVAALGYPAPMVAPATQIAVGPKRGGAR